MLVDLGFAVIRLEIAFTTVRSQVCAELANGVPAALKKCREITGASLKDAVDYVNRLLPPERRIGRPIGEKQFPGGSSDAEDRDGI